MRKLFSLSLILVVSPVTGREGRSTKVPGKPLGVPKEAGPFLSSVQTHAPRASPGGDSSPGRQVLG